MYGVPQDPDFVGLADPDGNRIAVRGHLLELAGDDEAALACYRRAARLTISLPERHYLHGRAARLLTQAGKA